MKKRQNSVLYVLRIALVLLTICALTSAAVSLVYAVTYQKADENQQAVRRAAIETIFGSGIEATETAAPDGLMQTFSVQKDGKEIGVCALVRGSGFGGDLDVMVGFSPDGGKIVGVRVTAHTETSGLGSRIAEEDYLSQYIGKSGQLTLNQEIDAISGSTISSRALLEAVNKAQSLLFGKGAD